MNRVERGAVVVSAGLAVAFAPPMAIAAAMRHEQCTMGYWQEPKLCHKSYRAAVDDTDKEMNRISDKVGALIMAVGLLATFPRKRKGNSSPEAVKPSIIPDNMTSKEVYTVADFHQSGESATVSIIFNGRIIEEAVPGQTERERYTHDLNQEGKTSE